MSTVTTIHYDDQTTATITSGTIPIEQDENGFLFHNGKAIFFDTTPLDPSPSIESRIDGVTHTAVVLSVTPDAHNQDHVFIEMVTIFPRGGTLQTTRADPGGMRWSVVNGRGLKIEFTVGDNERQYDLDTSSQPPGKLRVVILKG